MFEVHCASFKLVIAGYHNTAYKAHIIPMIYYWYMPRTSSHFKLDNGTQLNKIVPHQTIF